MSTYDDWKTTNEDDGAALPCERVINGHRCGEPLSDVGVCATCDDDDSDGVPVETDDETAQPVESQTVRLDTRPTAELAREWVAKLDSREAA